MSYFCVWYEEEVLADMDEERGIERVELLWSWYREMG